MLIYTLRRLAFGVILFVLVSLITFWLLSFSFDDAVTARLGPAASPETTAALMRELGLDRPVMLQYFDWLAHVVQGDLGKSFFTGEPVASAVPARMGVTLSIVVPALLISVAISVILGVTAAARGGVVDKVVQGMMLFGYLVPNLLVAIFFVVLFAIQLHLLPATGFTPFSKDPAAWARSVTIPIIALVVAGAANISNQIRGAMIDELRRDYVRTLRTRGISPMSIVIRHALRNAAGPALTVFGFEFITMFGGALIIEQVFALPGYGIYSFNSALENDFPVILGLTVFGVFLTVGVNLVTDLANGWLNPKARIH